MVETEESAEAIASLHGGGRALRRCRGLQKPVVESLVVSLAVIVLDVLPREEAHDRINPSCHPSELVRTMVPGETINRLLRFARRPLPDR